MNHGYYCGTNVELYAQGAILRVGDCEGQVFAQFDDFALGHGWTHAWNAFRAEEFRSLPYDERLRVVRNEEGLWDLERYRVGHREWIKVAVNFELRGEIDIQYWDIKLPPEEIEFLIMCHRYRYYVLCEPTISDGEYDKLEAQARALLPPESPVHSVGSSLEDSYSEEVKEFCHDNR